MQTSSWNLDRSRLEQVACPLCQGIEFERLAATDRYNMGLVTVGCLGCGLVMTNPQPTAEALDDFTRTTTAISTATLARAMAFPPQNTFALRASTDAVPPRRDGWWRAASCGPAWWCSTSVRPKARC